MGSKAQIYYHTQAQASQGLSRRAHRDHLLGLDKPPSLCPSGLSACRVGPDSTAFEVSDSNPFTQGYADSELQCIDTNNDIDSCGGCVHRSLDDPLSKSGEM